MSEDPSSGTLVKTINELKEYYGDEWNNVACWMTWLIQGFDPLPTGERDIWTPDALWNAAKLSATMIELDAEHDV